MRHNCDLDTISTILSISYRRIILTDYNPYHISAIIGSEIWKIENGGERMILGQSLLLTCYLSFFEPLKITVHQFAPPKLRAE